ncbi:hypothetical protein HaLaN_26141 [Haematococcus lacustris]|uniref:Uncharacterized protein n=1 Tax=Haematococcus lacustris TaxID=44745 RepID=A0A6A0A5J4_HAELA|nr:hypothetical protein HaLaN_26141 [Haematococcus lacustris]
MSAATSQLVSIDVTLSAQQAQQAVSLLKLVSEQYAARRD